MTGPRTLAAYLILGFAPIAPAADPVPPKTVTLARPAGTLADVAGELSRQTGIPVELAGPDGSAPCPVRFAGTPFWSALDEVAGQTNARIALHDHGRQVRLEKRTDRPAPSSVDGAFRVVVRQVQSRTDFDAGKTFAEVTLEIHWEPRFPVFRLDAQPTITAASADTPATVTPLTSRARTPPSGYTYTTTVRLEGIPRSASKIARLAGAFSVTAAPKMLQFEFKDLASAKPLTASQDGVSAVLKPPQRIDSRWEVELEVTYPPQPEFESFESWVTENRLQLIAPTGRAFEPADFDIPEQGRKLVAIYRFPADPGKGLPLGDRKGWSAVYRTPAPLVEFPVRFDLRDIPLP